MVQPLCKTCETGTLAIQRVHRLSGPAVAIGYILLIPSILGILFAIFSFAAVVLGVAGSPTRRQVSETTINRLYEARVDHQLIAKLKDGKLLTDAEKAALMVDQRKAVDTAETELAAAAAGTGCALAAGTGCAIFIAVASLVSGVVGWLLVMKKRVLKCGSCGAVVAAS